MLTGTPAHRRRGFQIHATVFVLSAIALVVIKILTGPPYWIAWSLPGWAIGLFAHWFFVLGPGAGPSES